MKTAAAGTADRWPSTRLSSAITRWPRLISTSEQMLPIYPAPPVTRIFNENPPGPRDVWTTYEYTGNADSCGWKRDSLIGPGEKRGGPSNREDCRKSKSA